MRTPLALCRTSLAATCLLLLLAAPLRAQDTTPPERLRVLFLGDRGHHEPAARAEQLIPVLGERGIDVTYTERVEDLNPLCLSHYQGLILFANIDTIESHQAAALLDFVASGGGFVPIHCASYCFRNSEAIVQLIGAQFLRHGGEVFTARVLQPDHPALAGFEPFASWDETYAHTRHNPDRTVLMVRDEPSGQPEPYTWVRTHGSGRVFYTALGHDQRTWGQPEFQDLIESGLRWACAEAPGPKGDPFEYVEARIPYYPPSDQWGTLGEPIRKMPKPLSPELSMQRMQVPPHFRVELFAAEPDIVNPIAMTWDERGRLWIAETIDYPNNLAPERRGNDRIRICEDTDGDGRADRFTVFAEGLNIPTSLCFSPEGLIVAQAPDMILFKDTDGDDRADERTVLLTGFGTGDTHAGPSNLRYGFDGWIWGTVGYSAFNGQVGDQTHRFGQGVFRFRPDGSDLELLTSTSNNTWGLGFSEAGDVFASTANNEHSVLLAIPNRVFEGVRGWHGQGSQGIADHRDFHPVTHKVRQVDWHHGYTAAAGHAIYTARRFPPLFWNRVALVCEPTGHLIHACALQTRGTQFVTRDAYNLLASDDEWTAPIAAEVGPDGAVWFLDWYNYIVQHNPTPRGFETGRGNAYKTPARDKQHGRVYRIVPDGEASSMPSLAGKSDLSDLMSALEHDNLFWRLTAQRMLTARIASADSKARRKLTQSLSSRITRPKIDALQLDVGAQHALWMLALLEAPLERPVSLALAHPSAAVRRTALTVAPRTESMWMHLAGKRPWEDPDPFVRREALLVLAELPPIAEAGGVVYELLDDKANTDDRWIPIAAAAAAARHDAGFLAAMLDDAGTSEAAPRGTGKNVLVNGSLEEGDAGWRWVQYSGQATGDRVTPEGSTPCLRIHSGPGADASFSQAIAVEPFSTYRLSGRIRTSGLGKQTGLGALLNVHELQGASGRVATEAVTGTQDWTRVEVIFNSAGNRRLTVNCLFGGWGRSVGTAWYDDLELVWLGSTTGSGVTDEVLRVVTQHYAQRGPTDSVLPLLSRLRGASAGRAAAFLSGLRAGWPAETRPTVTGDDRAVIEELLNRLSTGERGSLLALLEKWELREAFSESRLATLKALRAAALDRALTIEERCDAAGRLLALDDTDETVEALLDELTPSATVELCQGWLRELRASRRAVLGELLVERWDRLPPRARPAAIDLLAKRRSWTEALLTGIEERFVTASEINADQRQLLTRFAAPEIRERATTVLADGGGASSVDSERVEALIASLASQRGDAKAGRTVYAESCQTCHRLGETGGLVGPELNGLAAKPRPELLTAILDPNQSVEENYRAWLVETTDGLLLTGRLENETQTTIALLDSNGERHELQRTEIESLTVSPLSIMPEGFDRLSEKQLADLLELLTSH